MIRSCGLGVIENGEFSGLDVLKRNMQKGQWGFLLLLLEKRILHERHSSLVLEKENIDP